MKECTDFSESISVVEPYIGTSSYDEPLVKVFKEISSDNQIIELTMQLVTKIKETITNPI